MKKFLLICLTALISTMAWAYDFSADYEGHTIYYNIVDGGVEVTYEIGTTDATASYSGDKLTIPSTVTCDGVTYDVIGIGENAFYKPQVTVIKIPKSVTYIGQKAFYSNSAANSKLETIEFEGDGLESIGMQAFYYAPLTSIELPSTVSSMGDQCFRNCGSLVSANIPASLKYVPANTFSACKLMESISFDGDVEEIYNNAFYQCNALKDVEIPKSVAVIGASAFQYCYALTEITIPEKVDSLGNFAFSDCTALATVISLNSTPPATGGAKVFSSIADECVLYVPEGCKEAYLAAEVWQDFGEDNILELAPLEEGIKFQVGDLYYNVVSTEDLEVEVTYGGSSYTTVTESYTGDMRIPDTVDYMSYTYHVIGIGEYAFRNSTLTSLELPASGSISYIGQQAFYQNKSLVSISLPEGLETLGYRTFYNCTALESAMLPNSVSSMDENVFYGCKALIQGNIPTSLVELPTSTFSGCSALTTVIIGQENSEEEQAQIKLETIKNNAFYQCSILENVTIPKTVTLIESSAFYECEKGLKSIEIPELVDSIGGKAFKSCRVLEEIICLNENPPACGSDDVFGNVPEDCVLYVPAGCKEAYEEAYVWKEFSDIEELAPFYCTIDPEDGEIVPELSQITFSNDEGIFFNEDFDSEYAPVIVYDSEGEEVSYIDYIDTIEDADGLQISQIVNLDEAVVEAGDYKVFVAAKLFYIIADGRKTYNSEITLSYTIEPEDVIQGLPDGYLVDPENESYLESLSSFTLSLESGAALTQGSDFSIISVVDHWGVEVTTVTLDDESEPGKVICTLDEEISTVGTYFINFNKGALYDFDKLEPSPAFMLTYYVTGAPIEYSFDPEDGAILESLSEFTVGYEDGIYDSYSYLGQITVEDEYGEVVAYDVECIENEEPDAGFFDPILSCTIKLNTTITAEGTYTVTIPEGYFTVGEDSLWSDEIVISYTIKTDAGSETGIGGISLDSENVEGIYSIGGQKLNAAQKGVNIVRMNDGNVKKILVK